MKLVLDEDHMLIVFGLLAVLVILSIWRVFRRWSASDETAFSLSDLFMENGKASKGAVVLIGAFASTTWMFIYYTLLGKMTEGYFGLYSAAWIAPVVAKMIAIGPAASSPTVTTSTASVTTETKTP